MYCYKVIFTSLVDGQQITVSNIRANSDFRAFNIAWDLFRGTIFEEQVDYSEAKVIRVTR